MSSVCFNGDFLPASQPIFNAQNRGFRYGDGLFETIKVVAGQIILEKYHFDRLFFGIKLLRMSVAFDAQEIATNILKICQLNQCLQSARVRLAVYRNDNDTASYVIEAMPLLSPNQLNDTGWSIDLYPYARKSVDAFANLKTANYLPYVLADKYAKEKALDESIVLNVENHLCDASKANIFLVLNDAVYTPALHQGCVNGVMRRFVIEELKRLRVQVYQQSIDEALLQNADEVFLTNCINDMRWVKNFRDRSYRHNFTRSFYEEVRSTIYG